MNPTPWPAKESGLWAKHYQFSQSLSIPPEVEEVPVESLALGNGGLDLVVVTAASGVTSLTREESLSLT